MPEPWIRPNHQRVTAAMARARDAIPPGRPDPRRWVARLTPEQRRELLRRRAARRALRQDYL